jgi:general secretion pathway protein G
MTSFAQQSTVEHEALLQLQKVRQSLQLYFNDMAQFPSAEQGLQALVKNPDTASRWRGPYASDREASQDLWGTSLRYFSSAAECVIMSAGRDKKFATNDDLVVLALTP